jgi:16S rRNA (cytosine1402-N4)-methyltransferase
MHVPVMATEAVAALDPRPGCWYVDATLGCGGYTAALLAKCPECRVLGIDVDAEALAVAREVLLSEIQRGAVTVVHDTYIRMREAVAANGSPPIHGVVFDLGMSSLQLGRPRGFSFSDEHSLDMRMNPDGPGSTAQDLLRRASAPELEELFRMYGEERHARLLARRIVEERRRSPITTAAQLAELVRRTIGRFERRGATHPATRVFQALRIAVNRELDNVTEGLSVALDVLVSGGRCVAVSYHSLEDRIVKQVFRGRADCRVLTRTPLLPSESEVSANRAARSAKLRVVQKQ